MDIDSKEIDSHKYGVIFTKYSVIFFVIFFIILELFFSQSLGCEKKSCITQTLLWGAWILVSSSFLFFGIIPVIVLKNKRIALWYLFYLVFFAITFLKFIK